MKMRTSGSLCREIENTHSVVIARLDRATQYSRDAYDWIDKPRRTGYPAFAGYDDRVAFDISSSLPATNAERLRKGAKRQSNPPLGLPRR